MLIKLILFATTGVLIDLAIFSANKINCKDFNIKISFSQITNLF